MGFITGPLSRDTLTVLTIMAKYERWKNRKKKRGRQYESMWEEPKKRKSNKDPDRRNIDWKKEGRYLVREVAWKLIHGHAKSQREAVRQISDHIANLDKELLRGRTQASLWRRFNEAKKCSEIVEHVCREVPGAREVLFPNK